MQNTTETPFESPSGGNGRGRGVAQWVFPAALLALFIVTALAARLVRKDGLGERADVVNDPTSAPVQGGVFRFPLEQPIHTLDPAQAVFSVDVMLIQQLYDGLTAFDKNLNVVPALAKFWEISPDGKVYTFELRDDARFHNGRKVTAFDCVYSFQRLLTKGINEHNYHYFSRIEGAEAFREGRSKSVSGLEAVDDVTFRIRFATPFVPALSVLSMYSSKILPQEELVSAGKEFFQAPIGTGAFQFARWIEPSEDPGVPTVNGVRQGLRLEANPYYHEGRAHLDALVFRASWNSPEFDGNPRPLDEVADCVQTNGDQAYGEWVAVEVDRLLAIRYLHFPNQVAPYNDPRVRLAINLALDKRSFRDSHRAARGVTGATGVVPPGIPGFIPKESPTERDLERARQLLVEAGYPGGKGLPPLELPVSRGEANDTDRCLIYCLASIGVEVRPVRANDLGTEQASGARLQYNTWYADFPDPDNFLRPLFHSSGYRNVYGYNNPEVDRLLDQVWSETSYTERNKLYHRIEELVLQDAPIIPTDYGRLRYLLRPNVKGFTLTPLGAPYIKMKDVWFAQEGPATEVEL
ncbi:MAG TPA: ABC transporter substrate-binding protein [Vicinamibacteria bacterium]|nr:ABC transporter substrate-binding protein [Vicinamibacteria bacterium]